MATVTNIRLVSTRYGEALHNLTLCLSRHRKNKVASLRAPASATSISDAITVSPGQSIATVISGNLHDSHQAASDIQEARGMERALPAVHSRLPCEGTAPTSHSIQKSIITQTTVPRFFHSGTRQPQVRCGPAAGGLHQNRGRYHAAAGTVVS